MYKNHLFSKTRVHLLHVLQLQCLSQGPGLQIFFDACINQIGVEIHLATVSHSLSVDRYLCEVEGPAAIFFCLTMFRQQSQYDSRLRFSSRVLVRVSVMVRVRVRVSDMVRASR